MQPIAVIDLGSNSVRMSVSTADSVGKWETLLKLRETVRLGQGMEDGYLRPEAMERVLEALCRFRLAAESMGCGEIVATATQAVRIAKNREDFLAEARSRAGIDFRVLSGEEEANYSFLAVRETLPIDSGLLFDTGGGSTEIILVKNRRLVRSISTPCGAVMLSDRFSPAESEALYAEVKRIIGGIDWLSEAEGLPLYGIGGSARTLGSLYKRKAVSNSELNGMEITPKAIDAIYRRIEQTPVSERAAIEGMDASRADVILAGLTPMKVMADMLKSPKLILCSYGVKEGVFFERKNAIIKKKPTLNIVLVEPEIPQNTGNIARTCAAIGAGLHLVKPLGFEISDKNLKRAGLDYWYLLDISFYENLDDFFERTRGGRYVYATTKAPKMYCEESYAEGDYILFGKETKGLPEELLKEHTERCVRIPMTEGARSLNLGNSVAVIAYEAMRQTGFGNLKEASDYLENN